MDDWDVPLEETGEFDRQGDEGANSADAGWKDELNLAEFPIAALTDRIPDGQTTMVFEDRMERRDSADRAAAHDHGHAQARPADLAGRRGPGGADPVDQAAEQLHRRAGAVLALRADRAAGLAAERAELPADRGGVAPLGRRGADVRERLVGQRGQELGRRAVPRAGQRDALRPGAVADLGAVGAVGQGGPGRVEGRQAPPALVELPLERGDLPELPERQPQAARPGVLPQAEAADDQADVPVPGQAVLPAFPAGLRPAVAGLRARRPEPIVCADGVEAAAQAGPGGARAARVPRAAGPRGARIPTSSGAAGGSSSSAAARRRPRRRTPPRGRSTGPAS